MKSTLIVGMGASGQSVARYLLAQGQAFDLADSRTELPNLAWYQQHAPKAKSFLGPLSKDLLSGYERLIVSPGLCIQRPPFSELGPEHEIIGDIELFAQHLAQHQQGVPVVAITGSNGKSTVTQWVADMAEQAGIQVAVGGNLGLPALDLLGDQVGIYVLELSSFQLETTHSLKARAATILNVSPDHLDRYASYQAYIDCKKGLWSMAAQAIVNLDDPSTWPEEKAPTISFSLYQAANWQLMAGQLCHQQQPVMASSELALPGEHNIANALAAAALADALGVPHQAIVQSWRTYQGLQHRCQWVAERKGAQWFNDSKGTNVGATLAAVQGLSPEGRLILLAGGDGKGADFFDLLPALASKRGLLLAYGQDAGKLCAQLQSLPHFLFEDLDQAVAKAYELAQPGDLVLLSPACASLDQFTNYQQRGLHFCRLVEGLS